MDARPFDALLLVSFGGPEHPDDVVPFLENVTAGRGIPRERLEEVGQHYFLFGGKSPINELNLELLDALRKDFSDNGVDLPDLLGQPQLGPLPARRRPRRWRPTASRARHASSRAPTRRTRAAGSTARTCTTRQRPRHRAEPAARTTSTTRASSGRSSRRPRRPSPTRADGTHVVFVTHSIPETMNAASGGPGRAMLRRQARGGREPGRRGPGTHRWSPGLLLAVGLAAHAVARAGHQRPPARAAPSPASRRSSSCRSASSPTTWRSSTTSTPRPR